MAGMKQILILSDFSKKAQHAAEYALNLAVKFKADLLLFHGFDLANNDKENSFNWRLKEYFEAEDYCKMHLQQLKDMLELRYAETYTQLYKPSIGYFCKEANRGQLGPEIKDFIHQKGIWLVVMGAKAEDSLSNFIFGTNTYSVLSTIHRPILLVPQKAPIKTPQKIAIAADFQDNEYSPLLLLREFKETFDSDIVITHIPSELATVGQQTTEVAEYDAVRSREVKRVSFTDIYGNDLDNDLIQFALKSKIDLLGLVYSIENLYQRIYNSDLTSLLTENSQPPLLVFPDSFNLKDYEST